MSLGQNIPGRVVHGASWGKMSWNKLSMRLGVMWHVAIGKLSENLFTPLCCRGRVIRYNDKVIFTFTAADREETLTYRVPVNPSTMGAEGE